MSALGKSIALVAGGMVVGAGVTTLILKKRYQALLEEEIASVKAAYKKDTKDLKKQNLDLLDELTQPKVEETPAPEDKPLTEEDISRIKVADLIQTHEYGGGVIDDRPRFNPYDRTIGDFNPANETRSEDDPYVISISEFQNDEEDYEKITVRYFEEDDTLVAEMRTDPMPIESVGSANLLRFGDGSQDENIVYVRNEVLEMDFEVIKDEGSYVEQVLGRPEWTGEDTRNRKPRIKKMRDISD